MCTQNLSVSLIPSFPIKVGLNFKQFERYKFLSLEHNLAGWPFLCIEKSYMYMYCTKIIWVIDQVRSRWLNIGQVLFLRVYDRNRVEVHNLTKIGRGQY